MTDVSRIVRIEIPGDLFRRLSALAQSNGIDVEELIILKLREASPPPHQGSYEHGFRGK